MPLKIWEKHEEFLVKRLSAAFSFWQGRGSSSFNVCSDRFIVKWELFVWEDKAFVHSYFVFTNMLMLAPAHRLSPPKDNTIKKTDEDYRLRYICRLIGCLEWMWKELFVNEDEIFWLSKVFVSCSSMMIWLNQKRNEKQFTGRLPSKAFYRVHRRPLSVWHDVSLWTFKSF